MRIAYIAVTYRFPELLARTLRRLDGGAAAFLIHVDRRVDGRPFRAAVEGARLRAPVRWLARVPCRWGSDGIVRAALAGLAEALRLEPRVDRMVFLSGQDYPIKTAAAIAAHFVDELFFQTVLYNSPLRGTLVCASPTYTRWDRPGDSHPAILTRRDVDTLLAAEQLFARKFDPGVDADVLDMLDRRLDGG